MGLLQKARGRRINPDGSQERTFIVPCTVASDTAKIIPLVSSHVDLYIHKVYFTNQATVAQDGTNYRTVLLQDRGAAGTGTTQANTTFSTITTTGDGPLTAFVPTDMKATAGYKLAAGNVLAASFTDNGTAPAIDGFFTVVCK